MKRATAIFLLLAVLFCAACQPTPGSEPVPNKGDDKMEDAIRTTPVPTEAAPDSTDEPFIVPHIEVPEHWEESFPVGNYEIAIDADVCYEDCAHPVYLMTYEKNFDGALIKQLTEMIVKPERWTAYRLTREQILERLQNALLGTPVGNIDENGVPEGGYVMDEEAQENIDFWMEQLKNASTEDEWESFDVNDLPQGQCYIEGEDRKVYYQQNDYCFLIMDTPDKKTEFFSERLAWNMTWEHGTHMEFPEPEMPREDAVELTNTLLADLGLDERLSISYVTKGVSLYDRKETEGVGWFVYCGLNSRGAKMYPRFEFSPSGVPISLEEDGMAGNYRPPIAWESLAFYYEDGRIRYVCWEYPQKLLSVANPAVELLPFEDIEESIRKYFKYIFSINDDGSGKLYHKINVTEVGLSYLPSAKKDDIKAYYWAPVWAVVYNYEEMSEDIAPTVMYINAIDGTFVWFKMG